MDIVIQTVDRTPQTYVLVNTSVNLLHCPLKLDKEALARLDYRIYRKEPLTPLVRAVVERAVAQNGGKVPLGGLELHADDIEGLPVNPAPKK